MSDMEDNQTNEAGGSAGAPRSRVRKTEALWLTSFADLSILLMCFFVMQLSYSSPDKKKYEIVKNAMKTLSAKRGTPTETLETVKQKIEEAIKKKKLDKVASVTYDTNGVAIEFRDAMLFGTGSSDLDPASLKTVEKVMAEIAKSPREYNLVIEGHTDDVPVTSGKFKNNWDLASARGISLVAAFKKRGVAENRISVRAFAATRPKVPISKLKGEDLKLARAANRRVVIRIE